MMRRGQEEVGKSDMFVSSFHSSCRPRTLQKRRELGYATGAIVER